MEISTKNFQQYCNSLVTYKRRKTIPVKIGDVIIGGDNPIVLQSMTTIDTMDTEGSIAQSIRMIDAGCELVRITAPSIKEAENLRAIKEGLVKRGYNTPLVADIHFTPNAAELAAKIVEKVRVNPGNYADKKKFENIEYTDESYKAELDRIKKRFKPLVKICKEHGTAMRIGTNHGSLSDRIMSRYGDTPFGMVESALEFIRICEEMEFYDIVVSMKSSNPQVMVQAYRLLVQKLDEEELKPYPLHLGVTEAGEAEDGRIKSSVGIGTLLEDGLGDTIRVSLTEEPEEEIPVAKVLADRYKEREVHDEIPIIDNCLFNPYEYEKRRSKQVANIGGKEVPIVMADFSLKKDITPASFFGVGYNYSVPLDKWSISDFACDYIFTNDRVVNFEIPGTLGIVHSHKTWLQEKDKERRFPFINAQDYLKGVELHPKVNFVYAILSDL
jgi:(E)-4-hydroxy-3-methylbut-2-enyl-diphosphate synthase